MKSILKASPLLGLIGVLGIVGTTALANPVPAEYGWTLSDSPINPYSNTGPPGAGVAVLYLHCPCTTISDVSAAEFDLSLTYGSGQVIEFVPLPPFLNAGGPANLQLLAPSCPSPPLVAGRVTCLFGGPDELCIVPSAANGLNETADCAGFPYPNVTVGYSVTGAPPTCDDRYPSGNLCWDPISVETTTWSLIKSLYR